jgi:serpin B
MTQLAASTNQFAFGLFAEALKTDAGKNVFISPASVSLALAMTLNGAQGETRKAMLRTLGLPPRATVKQLNAACAQLLETLAKGDPKVTLEIANSLWGKQGVDFKQTFLNRNKQFHKAEVETLDFEGDEAGSLKRINGWVAEKTKGKIDSILDEINADAILYLVNAIYFYGPWKHTFDKKQTRPRDFRQLDGKKIKTDMMLQSGDYDYYEDKDCQAISLPYGDGRYSMMVLLPKTVDSKKFASSLSADAWSRLTSQMRSAEGDIALPKFKLEYKIELKDALCKLGMGIAFDDRDANFKGICPVRPGENVSISKVKHKTFVEVNEEGTEAAAVTAIEMVRTTSVMIPPKRFYMAVDRPFVCAIRDNNTDTILFLGSIVNPNE